MLTYIQTNKHAYLQAVSPADMLRDDLATTAFRPRAFREPYVLKVFGAGGN